jgi:hypothetical protein
VILQACAYAPLSAYQLVPILYPRPLSSFDLQLALGECLAHLHYLRAQGRLTETALDAGVLGYRSVPELQRAPRPAA